MYQDYHDKGVQFFYVYKSLAHPEINNYVAPYTLQERLMHIAEAKKSMQTRIPWICDSMENDLKHATGGAPNGEFVIDPEGIIVRKRFWSNPDTLRNDLEELVGLVENPTRVEDLPTRFTVPKRPVVSGVVPRIELPAGMRALTVTPDLEGEHPHYVKLRAEASPGLLSKSKGEGQLYLGLYLDPLYRVHWNNRAGNVKLLIEAADGVEISQTELNGPEVAEKADVDPRQFLIDVKRGENSEPLELTLHYVACDDDETFCLPLTQRYTVEFDRDADGGSRPGVFMPGFFAKVREMDANGDGNLTKDELPEGKVSLYIGHMDLDANDIIESAEIDQFMTMFNNGRGFDSPLDDGSTKSNDD